jgi:hypothetical protein
MDELIATADEREQNSGNHGVCISFKKSNTSVDGSTGETKRPLTINAAVFSNDSEEVIQYYKQNGLPKFNDPYSDAQYSAPPFVKAVNMLPRSRKAIYCEKCDYYLS